MTQRAGSTARGYNARWQRARRTFLAHNPLCVACQAQGRLTLANEVDHIVPHKGDRALFWDSDNWQPLCKSCHSSKTAREERNPDAPQPGCDADGVPLDPAHWWR